MSTMNLPPVINPQYLDNNGVILSGGKIYSYQAGTSTPQATYTDQSGVTPNANPIILDSAGRCSMWLDPTLSYKFVIQDSSGNTIKTVDNVVGLLTANAVATASLQDGAVTSSKLAAGSVNVTNLALASDASVDANRPVNTNNIRNSAVTRAKISSSSFAAMNVQKFTATGSGTYNPTYIFFVSIANATAGATYSNNGQTFTVANTISGAAILYATGPGAPQASGTLTKTSGTGDASIAFNSYIPPLYIRVKMIGGGGGGGAGGNSHGAVGTAGGNTTFGSILTANGGNPGNNGGGNGGTGGTVTIGAGAIDCGSFQGGQGQGNCYYGSGTVPQLVGGMGASSPFAGGGAGSYNSSGQNAIANSGAGGGGSGPGQTSLAITGSGGGAGGFIDAMIQSPSSQSLSVGTGGTGEAGGDFAGGNGGSGIVIVYEYFQ